MGHEAVKAAVKAHLQTWMPVRLLTIRDGVEPVAPPDPAAYLAADTLPQNDPNQYPAVVITSTRTLGASRRTTVTPGEPLTYDVDYEVAVVVAATIAQVGGEEDAVRDRDRLLLALRECVMLPAPLTDAIEILQNPPWQEITGAAAQDLRGQPLAAGQITFTVRAAEVLLPTETLAEITSVQVLVQPNDASTESLDIP